MPGARRSTARAAGTRWGWRGVPVLVTQQQQAGEQQQTGGQAPTHEDKKVAASRTHVARHQHMKIGGLQ